MNGEIEDQVIIKRVAVAIEGIHYEDLTCAERDIYSTLQQAGWVKLEGDDKVIRLTPYSMQFQ